MGVNLRREVEDYVRRDALVEQGSDETVTFVMSSDTKDRYGDSVKQDAWRLDNFRANPVFLWAHDAFLPPIGRVENVRVEDGRLKGDVRFVPDGEPHPMGDGFAGSVRRLYQQGFLSAVSVGFRSEKYYENDEGGLSFAENELLELSAVPIPANPEALMEAHKSGIDLTGLEKYYGELLSGDDDSLIARSYSVIREIREAQQRKKEKMEELQKSIEEVASQLGELRGRIDALTELFVEEDVETEAEVEENFELGDEERTALVELVRALVSDALEQHKGKV